MQNYQKNSNNNQHSLSNTLLWLRDYLAGSLAGIFQVIIGQPFDIVKVRLAISDKPGKTIKSITAKILKTDGIMGFYKGSLPPFIGATFIQTVQFGQFEKSKQYFHKQNQKTRQNYDNQLDIAQIAYSGVIANIFSSFIQAPIDHIRIKRQGTICTQCPCGIGSLDCYKDIIKEKNIVGLYKGLMATLYRQIPGGIAYFSTYEGVQRYLKSKLQKNDQNTKIAQFIAGGVAGFNFWLVIYPLDNIKTRIQMDSIKNPKYKNYIDCVKQTIQNCGYRCFYKGIIPTLLRAIPVNAVSFLIFEETKIVMNYFAELAY